MPFPDQVLQEFTKETIQRLSPDLRGCYGILADGKYLYVGKGQVRGRLLDHLNGDKPCILNGNPTHFVGAKTTSQSETDELEKELIRELDPPCNERVG